LGKSRGGTLHGGPELKWRMAGGREGGGRASVKHILSPVAFHLDTTLYHSLQSLCDKKNTVHLTAIFDSVKVHSPER